MPAGGNVKMDPVAPGCSWNRLEEIDAGSEMRRIEPTRGRIDGMTAFGFRRGVRPFGSWRGLFRLTPAPYPKPMPADMRMTAYAPSGDRLSKTVRPPLGAPSTENRSVGQRLGRLGGLGPVAVGWNRQIFQHQQR